MGLIIPLSQVRVLSLPPSLFKHPTKWSDTRSQTLARPFEAVVRGSVGRKSGASFLGSASSSLWIYDSGTNGDDWPKAGSSPCDLSSICRRRSIPPETLAFVPGSLCMDCDREPGCLVTHSYINPQPAKERTGQPCTAFSPCSSRLSLETLPSQRSPLNWHHTSGSLL